MNRLPWAFGLCLISSTLVAQHADDARPSDRELLMLLNGNSESRKSALRHTGARLWEAADEFFPAMAACGDDPDVNVRRAVVMQVGQFMIWNSNSKPQDPRAIDFLLRMTHDDDYIVVYNCVYYGLSTVSQKSEKLIERLLDLVPAKGRHESRSVFGRVCWGCRSQADQTASRIQARIDKLNADQEAEAGLFVALHHELTDRFPTRLDRFVARARYAIVIAIKPPFFPANETQVKAHVRKTLGQDVAIDELIARNAEGEFMAVLFTKGIGHCVTALETLESVPEFDSPFHFSLDEMNDDDRERFLRDIAPRENSKPLGFDKAFRDLYEQLGRDYPNFEMKQIDWKAVGDELLPRSETLQSRAQFCILCQELVARLEDSHAYIMKGTATPVNMPFPQWDPGFACLFDDRQRPVVYHVDKGSPAETAGLQLGMTVTHLNGRPVDEIITEQMARHRKYNGYSSQRYLRYQTVRWLARQMDRNAAVKVTVEDLNQKTRQFEMHAQLGGRYLPRLPVPMEGIADAGSVSWKRMEGEIGYIYVRRIRGDLVGQLDRAVRDLKECAGLVIDVRGNSGGGFDARRALRNFDLEDGNEPLRPRFAGPIAVLIDSRCISAGEGWSSWFKATGRAQFFGMTTAGASSRKKTIEVAGGLYKVLCPVKAYTGFLDRPIERRGIEPDHPVRQTAKDLAVGRDTVLYAATEHLKQAAAQRQRN